MGNICAEVVSTNFSWNFNPDNQECEIVKTMLEGTDDVVEFSSPSRPPQRILFDSLSIGIIPAFLLSTAPDARVLRSAVLRLTPFSSHFDIDVRKEDEVLGGFEVVLREESPQGPFSPSGSRRLS